MKGTGEISINDCPLARMRSTFFSSSLTSNRLGSDQLLKERKQRDFDRWLSSRAHAVSLEPPHELMTHEPLRRRRSWGRSWLPVQPGIATPNQFEDDQLRTLHSES